MAQFFKKGQNLDIYYRYLLENYISKTFFGHLCFLHVAYFPKMLWEMKTIVFGALVVLVDSFSVDTAKED